MNYDHLYLFVNLAETLNFSETALQMNISQSAVSQTISSMENELGFPLFYRTRKQVSLTRSGKNFYQSLKPLLNTYNKAVQQARQIASKGRTDLTIGYSGTPFETDMIPIYMKYFHLENPEINIFLENYAHKELKDHLTNGDCDVIFTMPDIVKNMEGIKYIDLYTGKYCAIFPPSIAFNRQANNLSDLNQYRLIFLDSQWSPPTQKKLQGDIHKANKDADLVYVNNISTSNVMVKAELGVGIWADFVSSPKDKNEKRMPLNYKIKPHYGIAILKKESPDSALIFSHWLQHNYFKYIKKYYSK